MERVIASTVEEELKERERRLGQLVWTEVNSGPEHHMPSAATTWIRALFRIIDKEKKSCTTSLEGEQETWSASAKNGRRRRGPCHDDSTCCQDRDRDSL
jgi:hypothetical protein